MINKTSETKDQKAKRVLLANREEWKKTQAVMLNEKNRQFCAGAIKALDDVWQELFGSDDKVVRLG